MRNTLLEALTVRCYNCCGELAASDKAKTAHTLQLAKIHSTETAVYEAH